MTSDLGDTARLRHAIRDVIAAARLEAAAFRQAADECVDDSMIALRESHLNELNAVQALLGALELFEARASGTSRRGRSAADGPPSDH